MAGSKGNCPKCRKPYLRLGKRYEKHVASCDGTPWAASTPRVSRSQPKVPVEEAHVSPLDQLITFSKCRRLDLERQKELVKAQVTIIDNEMASIDRTLAFLQQAKRE